ncbi:hypothetical protein [Halolamina sediminis]|uniref:hypothetical protein n=1 Tax=Halolamina sediminis TaxID=1480675 RepID=UPI0006B4C3D2|nr:hypothetical protein [Halolamina sediminis]
MPSTPPPTDDDGEADGSLSWTVSPDTNRPLSLLGYGLYGPIGAVALVLAGGAVVATVSLALEGSWGPVFLLAIAVVVALARPPVLAAIKSGETTASVGYEGWSPSWRGALAASTLCGTAMLAALQHSRAAAGAVAVVSFAAGVIAMALHTEASIDADGRLETQYATATLRSLSGVRSLDLIGVTVFRLSYARGADSFRNPRLIAVPSGQAAEVRKRLAAGVTADPEAEPIGRTERAVVALFALGVLATGPGLALLVGDAAEGGVVVVAYAGLFSVVFAAPMLWYAWKG